MTLAELQLPSGPFTIRRADESDLGPIVALLAADQLRASVESIAIEDRHPYELAFRAIDADPAQLLVAVVTPENAVVGTMQLTFIPGLARAGATRLQIEAVRVRSDLRGNGLGGAMIAWAIAEGRRRGAKLVQLTSDGSRVAAHRFYERLSFEPSHVGFKLSL
jgi:GNAT superfamily N-acetyltransferase